MSTIVTRRTIIAALLALACAAAFSLFALHGNAMATPTGDLEAATSPDLATQAATPQVSYRVHVQDDGWQDYRDGGTVAGTSGRSLRLEGINIRLSGASGGISYQTHVQNIGWQSWKGNGKMAGTTGQSLRLEGIRIKLTGDIAKTHDVVYRVHVQNIGWMSWVKNGELAGTTGQSLRLEAIQIKLVEKQVEPVITYRAHVQDIGWKSYVKAGKTAGTTKRGLRVEALQVKLNKGVYTGDIKYSAYVQGEGWQSYVSSGSVAGTTGEGLRVEALRMKLSGDLAKAYNVYYRVHVQNYGWMDWAKNGAEAGSTGKGLRAEAFQVVLVKKGDPAPGKTDVPTVNLLKTTMDGIDIASWQAGIDVESVDADFVIVKATQGTTYINPYFTEWADATLKCGKKLGIYHFAVTGDAVKQADYFVSVVGPYIGRAVLFLDWENNDMTGDPTLLQGPTWAKKFLDRVYSKTGVRPLIYMSKSVTRAYNWKSVAKKYGLWVAQYPNYETTGYQSDPWTDDYGFGAWSAPTLFQYASTGRIGGYADNLDLDLFYGTESDWDALAAKQG